MLREESDVLLVGNTEAVEEIIGVGAAELAGILELGQVGVQVVVVLDGLNNVATAFHLEVFLGDDNVGVVDGHVVVQEITTLFVKGSRVSPGTLVVGNGPGGGAHHTQVVVAVRVELSDEGVLSGEASFLNYCQDKKCHRALHTFAQSERDAKARGRK